MANSSLVVSFNANNFETSVPGLIVKDIDYGTPDRELNAFDIDRADESKVTDAFYTKRRINVSCEIGGTTTGGRPGLEAAFDQLNNILDTVEGTLLVPQAGINREYVATKENILINDRKGGWADFDVQFRCSTPFSYETSSTSLYTLTSLVGSLYDFACTFAGTTWQRPTITVTLNSFHGSGSNKSIKISNPVTSEEIAVYRTWTAADVLLINLETGAVTVNGNNVEWSGTLPQWAVGLGNVRYSDDFTGRNFNISIAYRKRRI